MKMKKFVSCLVIAGLLSGPTYSARQAYADDQPGRPGGPGSQPAPAPAPVDTSGARNDGYRDGMAAGQEEGRRQGEADGRFRGSSEGETQGLRQCAEDLARRERERGRDEGYRQGSYEGDRQGRDRGAIEGQATGLTQGRDSGTRRARSDAERDATPPGSAQGRDEAEHSDASARGARDGYAQGAIDARADAVAKDYPRGRQTVRDEMERQPVLNRDQFSQLGNTPSALEQRSRESGLKLVMNDTSEGTPRSEALSSLLSRMTSRLNAQVAGLKTAATPARAYPTPEENAAYQEGFRSGRDAGYRSGYDEVYNRVYRDFFEQGRRRGCDRARQKSYQEDYDRGYREGRSEGYDRAYRASYDSAYRMAYEPAFRQADQKAYGDNYANFYHQAFEAARSRAYSERVGQLYDAAFEASHDARYAEVRPGFGEEEYQRGRRDESIDFQQRPVRLLEASVTETNGNSLIEPEETLRIRLVLRNFSTKGIDANQVTLMLNALDENSTVVSSRQMPLARGLNAASITTVSEAFEFFIKDAAVARASKIQLKVLIGERSAGEQTLSIRAQYAIQTMLAEAPAFHNGLETVLKISLKNISGAATEPTLRVRLDGTAPELQIPTPEQVVQGLAPGETRIVEFPLITRTSDESVRLPLAISVQGGLDSKQRKIGSLAQTQDIPVLSDYKIVLLRNDSLRIRGSAKMVYQVQNHGSENTNRDLHVRLSFPKSEQDNDLTAVGTYPLKLVKINQGGALKLSLPVQVNRSNSGGTAMLELFEGSRLLLIHRYDF